MLYDKNIIIGYLLGLMVNAHIGLFDDIEVSFENGVLYIKNAPAELLNFLLEV